MPGTCPAEQLYALGHVMTSATAVTTADPFQAHALILDPQIGQSLSKGIALLYGSLRVMAITRMASATRIIGALHQR
jgi:hypothetical protein